jgi:LacI family transcriptional regulator
MSARSENDPRRYPRSVSVRAKNEVELDAEAQRPGRASMREVAELAGVATSSVSRVLSEHPDVSPTMRARVMAAVEQLSYHPDLLAQSLRLKTTKSVGFVVGDIANPLLAEVVQGAETALGEAGYAMLLTNSENDPARDVDHVRLFEQRRVDGLMLSLASEENPEIIGVLAAASAPVVLIDRELPESVPASVVLSDHRSGMRAAVEHLLDLGHRDIGLLLGQAMRPTRERRGGLEDAYSGRGLPPTYTVVEGMLAPGHGRAGTRQLLDQATPPTAIVAGGNQLLIGALYELRDRGLAVGRDISLASCDAISLTELFTPPIAIVKRANSEIGRQAAMLMLRRIRGESGPERVVLPTEFVPRPSCAPPAR